MGRELILLLCRRKNVKSYPSLSQEEWSAIEEKKILALSAELHSFYKLEIEEIRRGHAAEAAKLQIAISGLERQ